MGTKTGRIYGKEAPFKGAPQTFGGAVAPNCTSPWIRHRLQVGAMAPKISSRSCHLVLLRGGFRNKILLLA